MTGTTLEGRQAYALLDWVNDDPSQRVAEATARIAAMASRLGPGPALKEVQGVGTVIARLAGAVRPEPVAMANSISAQLARSRGIFAQVIEMAEWDPLKHPRGEHGKFAKKGTTISETVKQAAPDLAGRSRASVTAHNTASIHARQRIAADRAARRAQRAALRAMTAAGTAAPHMRQVSPADDIDAITRNIRNQVRDENKATRNLQQREAEEAASKAELKALEAKLDEQIAKAEKQSKEIEHDISEEHRAELGVEVLTIAAGAALAFFGSHLGMGGGGESAAAVALGPFLIKTAIEKMPDIFRALANFGVVGKGKGREWISHPIKKPEYVAQAGMRVAKRKYGPAVHSASQRAMRVTRQIKTMGMRKSSPPPTPPPPRSGSYPLL